MGVTGLWKLIEPCGKPVPVETLEGKILAIDISIWLHQVVKGFQDNKGAALNNAHLLGLFHRLCKLMYYRVKPVFVFDGCVPQLKMETIARRQKQRSKLNTEADRIQALLLQSLAKEKVVQQALGPNAEFLLTSPVKKLAAIKANRKEDTVDDMFKLPELPSTSKANADQSDDQTTDDSFNESSFYMDEHTTTVSTDESSFEESNPRNAYNSNLQAIDVKSKEFLQLPADVRHEILIDIKETRKQSSWGRIHELPSRSDDFSNFQMKRLLKRRDVQVSLEKAEQEMGGRTLTYAELTNIFSEEGILETGITEKGAKSISSDEHTRFLLVKDLKKKLSQVKEEPIQERVKVDNKKTNESSSSNSENDKQLGDEYEADLELAIALSIEEENNVYDEKDYEFDTNESLKLTKDQRQQLQNAAKGPAHTYMIEYAGMNKEDVIGILEKTQIKDDLDDTLNIEHLIGDTEEELKIPEIKKTKQQNSNSESQDIRLYVTDDSDSTDSDLEEVKDSCIKETSTEFIQSNVIENISTLKPRNDSNLENNISDSDTDSDLEVEDSNTNESKAYENKTEVFKNKLINQLNEDECVIEETPPLLQNEEVDEAKNCKVLSIQIDLREPLKADDDLFADIFDDKESQEEIFEETTTAISDYQEIVKTSPSILNKSETLQIKAPLKTENMLSILDQLKKEANEIKNIKLESIKLSESAIEISDDESATKADKVKNEIIEIYDSDDNTKRPTTPPSQLSANQSPISKSKSPKLKTPSKNYSITEFFDVDYIVKRTPDKPAINEENDAVPKVKSPFFVRKTPKSGRKSGSNSPSPNKKPSKVNKALFEQEPEDNGSNLKHNIDEDGVAPFIEPKPLSEEDVLKEAANILKAQTTTEQLNTIASNLVKERQDLENERNRQDRMGISITQRMNSDCQKLLRLFGVPFIVAPMEAEAQCAFLDIVQLTHGTITDDSDIWLFGGRTVYKNFFAQNKHVMEYRSEQIEKDFNCDRKKLIQLACLVGSDYTTGIHGIGAVTALEILASFTPKENINNTETSIQSISTTLQRFRNWWLSFKSAAAPPGSSARLSLQKKLKNIELHEGFPNSAVIEAYLSPKVDDNKEPFTWGYPDVESLKEFARTTFGWTSSKTDDILKPVLKKLNEKRTQQSIRNYFTVKNALSLRQIKVSKRVQNAIDRMTGNVGSDDTPEKHTKPKRPRKTVVKDRNKNETVAEQLPSEETFVNEICLTEEPSSSKQIVRCSLKRAAKRANIPETKQIIPQREKELAQIEANKKLAAEILKNTSKDSKRKRKA